MKILYIHQYFATPAGSTGTRSYEFSRYLVAQGHSVTVLTGTSAFGDLQTDQAVERRVIDGIEVFLINVHYSNLMSYTARIIAFVRFMVISTWIGLTRVQPDLVFATSTPLTVGIPGYIVSRVKRVPFVFELRDLWPKYAVAYGALKNRFVIFIAELLERFIYRAAVKIVTISETIANEVAEMGVPRGKLITIPIGADIQMFNPTPPQVRDFLQVTYTGTHSTVNALDAIVDAAKVIAARGTPAIRFVLVGEGRDKMRLKARVDEESVPNVEFRDRVPKDEIPSILQESDVCLISAQNIPEARAIFPNKLFDYLAAGRPIVGNFPGELAELIEREQIGVVAPPDDAEALANALTSLAASAAQRQEMGAKARELAETRFERTALAARLESLFEEVVRLGCGVSKVPPVPSTSDKGRLN